MTEPGTADLIESQRGAWVSIVAYIALTSLKLGVGWWSGSRGLVADGVNNLTDVIGSVTVLLGLRIAVRPADADHRYGHQKAETVATVVVAAIMGLIGLNVAVSAARAVLRPDQSAPNPLAIWVGLGSAAVMLGVYAYNIRLARQTGSQALAAAAYDNRSDVLTSIAPIVGVLGAQLGWRWTDPVAGHTLMDGFDVDVLGQIRQRAAQTPGVLGIYDLRARHIGNTVAVEVTVGVQRSLNVVEAHRVSEEIERSLLGYMAIGHVHVHVEPATGKLRR